MDTPQHPRDQAAVETMGFSGQIGDEVGKGRSFSFKEVTATDARGLIHMDNLEKERKIIGKYLQRCIKHEFGSSQFLLQRLQR